MPKNNGFFAKIIIRRHSGSCVPIVQHYDDMDDFFDNIFGYEYGYSGKLISGYIDYNVAKQSLS